MPKIVCMFCHNGYLRYQGQKQKFGRIVEKHYKCDGCLRNVTHDLDKNIWS